MGISCSDVCDEVIRRLIDLGIEVGEDEDHRPIMAGLEMTRLGRLPVLEQSAKRVKVEIRTGIAEVVEVPPGIEVEILDYDGLDDGESLSMVYKNEDGQVVEA